MSVGTIFLRVALDRPTQLYCGPNDTVTGNVLLTWQTGPKSRQESELFGPLTVVLLFHGRAKTKIWKRSNKTTHIYRGRAPLFAKRIVIHDGPIRITKGKKHAIPFSLNFPSNVQLQNTAPGIFDNDDARFNMDPNQPLPPSFRLEYRGFAHHFETFNEYRIGATATMRSIDVEVRDAENDFAPCVHYGPPRLPAPTLAMLEKQIVRYKYAAKVHNEFLVPESERASGFKQKAKAMFNSDYYPRYTFAVITEGTKTIYLGSPLMFEIRLQHQDTPAPGVIIPEITMSPFFSIRIDAYTQVRAEKGLFTCPESEGNEEVLRLVGALHSKGPFTKAEDWTKVINTKPVMNLPSTFATFNIARTYRVTINFSVSAAGENFNIEYTWPLVISPPLETTPATNANGDVVAGSSSIAGPSGMGSGAQMEPLPAYETPPVYDKAAEVAAGSVQPV